MGKSSPSPPAAPNPAATAAAQTASNVETARANAALNRVNQYTPQGSLTYSQQDGPAWDEQGYLAANPDVAAAVKSGAFGSGLQHYQKAGVNEGRTGVPAGYSSDPQWSAHVNLSPEQQALYNAQTQAQTGYAQTAASLMPRLQQMLSQGVDFSGLPWMGSAYQSQGDLAPTIGADLLQGDIGGVQGTQQRQRVEEALFGRLQPQMDRTREQMEQRLSARGLVPGSEAYSNAMRDLGTQENDARLGVTAAGGQEQQLQAQIANMLYGQRLGAAQSLFGQEAQGRQLGMAGQAQGFGQQEALRKQALSEMLAQRQIPMSEMAALLGGSAPQYPQFQNVPQSQMAPTDYMGAVQMNQAAQNNAYQGQLGQNASFNSGLASLGSAGILGAFAFSDERLKENIQEVTKTEDGLPLYLFNYKGDPTPHLGPMAQEVEKRDPSAVITDPGSGYKMVDYQAALFGSKRRVAA